MGEVGLLQFYVEAFWSRLQEEEVVAHFIA